MDINFFWVKISSNEYSEWLNTSCNIFFQSDVKNIPKPLTNCEVLFDKNVLPNKKLVHDIGNVSKLIHKEKKNFFYDDSNISIHTFFTEVNKKIQSYRLISLEYDQNNKNIINSKNKLKFNIINEIQKEFITFQLEDILNPKKLKQYIQK